jgi:thiol-disulfide isomerase/thioredoxin
MEKMLMQLPRKLSLAVLLTLVLTFPALADRPKVGEPAPDFHLSTVKDEHIRLADLRGSVVMVHFWASWCGPCIKELPLVDSFYRHLKDRGLVVLAIDTDEHLPAKYMQSLSEAMEMKLARGISGPYKPIGGAIPTDFIIDRRGVLRYAEAGTMDLDSMSDILWPLLKEPAPGVTPSDGANKAL